MRQINYIIHKMRRARRHPVPPIRRHRRQAISLAFLALILLIVYICLAVNNHKSRATVSEPYATAEPDVYVAIARYPVNLSDEIQQYTIQLCNENNIDPSIVFAIIDYESDCDASKVSDTGEAYGLMQIQPNWYTGTIKTLHCDDLTDPYQNIAVGVAILKEYYVINDDTKWVLTAYHAGINSADLNMYSQYADAVMSLAEQIDEGVQTGLMLEEVS